MTYRFKELDSRQKKAWLNIRGAINEYVGGLENTLSDNSADSEEYKEAYAILHDHKALVDTIYYMALHEIHNYNVFYRSEEEYLKDIRFCGKKWLLGLIEGFLKLEGY